MDTETPNTALCKAFPHLLPSGNGCVSYRLPQGRENWGPRSTYADAQEHEIEGEGPALLPLVLGRRARWATSVQACPICIADQRYLTLCHAASPCTGRTFLARGRSNNAQLSLSIRLAAPSMGRAHFAALSRRA